MWSGDVERVMRSVGVEGCEVSSEEWDEDVRCGIDDRPHESKSCDHVFMNLLWYRRHCSRPESFVTTSARGSM